MKESILIELEMKLESTEYRSSRKKLNELLHHDFKEVLTSGKTLNKEQVIEALIETSDNNDYEAYDFEEFFSEDSLGMVLFKTRNPVTSTTTQRSSLWKCENGKWQNYFHHATRIL